MEFCYLLSKNTKYMKTTKTYSIKGMHCASCAGIIEKTLRRQDGVSDISVNYGTD